MFSSSALFCLWLYCDITPEDVKKVFRYVDNDCSVRVNS